MNLLVATFLVILLRSAPSSPQIQGNEDLLAFASTGDSAFDHSIGLSDTFFQPVADPSNSIDKSPFGQSDWSNLLGPVAVNQNDLISPSAQVSVASSNQGNDAPDDSLSQNDEQQNSLVSSFLLADDTVPPDGPPLCKFPKKLHCCVKSYKILWCKGWEPPEHFRWVKRAREKDACRDPKNFYCCRSNIGYVSRERVNGPKDWGEGQDCEQVPQQDEQHRSLLEHFLEWLQKVPKWGLPSNGPIPFPEAPMVPI